jgi:glycosyltransferase involved in cell wall biosynthesis
VHTFSENVVAPAGPVDATRSPSRPEVTVVVPTRNESGNVSGLYARLSRALDGRAWELVFVDDSEDDTPKVIEGIAAIDPRVRCVHREAGDRHGGLGGAVLRGFATARADVLVVMDGDLQHPPEVVPELVSALAGADIAVASRFAAGGSDGGLSGPFRAAASHGCRVLSNAVLAASRATTDPMSGFFALRRSVVDRVALQPEGFKILLEVLARGRWTAVADVAFAFDVRRSGRSKSSVTEARRFLHHVAVLRRSVGSAPRHRAPPWSDGTAATGPRILVVTSEAPPVVSGIARVVGDLTGQLAQRGHRVSVVSRADFPRLMWHEFRLSAFALTWPAFRRRVMEHDIVNVHGPVPTMSEACLLLIAWTIRPARRPAIVYTHHSDLAIPGLERACDVYNRMHYRMARHADLTVVSSEDYADKVRAAGLPVQTVPWGVDTRGRVLPRATSPDRPLSVLFVGQLRPYKGVDVLLDAVTDLPGVRVTVIGDGPQLPALRARVAAVGLRHVEFRGRVPEDEKWRAYSEHDVVVLPSRTRAEAFGLVLAEGMAAGCVPLASDLPGVRGVVGSSGLAVAPGDAGALRAAIRRLAGERELVARLSADAMVRGASMSVEATGQLFEEALLAAYEAVLHRRAALALPSGWEGPAELLDEVTAHVGADRSSISLVHLGARTMVPVVYRQGGQLLARPAAPVASYVARLGGPVLINSQLSPEWELRTLLHRPEVTSAIVAPLHRLDRRSVSVLSVATTLPGAEELGREHLGDLLHLLDRRARVHV